VQFYMVFNIGIVAFVTATTLLVITKSDEAGSRRRAAAVQLRSYIKLNNLDNLEDDPRLKTDMKDHTDLFFDNEEVWHTVAACLRIPGWRPAICWLSLQTNSANIPVRSSGTLLCNLLGGNVAKTHHVLLHHQPVVVTTHVYTTDLVSTDPAVLCCVDAPIHFT
jgi:hypothetical protein